MGTVVQINPRGTFTIPKELREKYGLDRQAILEETPGVEVEIVQYLKSPYKADTLRRLFKGAGMTAREALRLRGTDAEERGLGDAGEEAIIAAMVENPAYVNRPFVETDKGVRFCRPQDLVREIL